MTTSRETERGWRVRRVKGEGFAIERHVADIGYAYPTRWALLEGWGDGEYSHHLRFPTAQNARNWAHRNLGRTT